MSIALVYKNENGDLLQFNDHAVGARIDDGKGHWIKVFYNKATDQFEIHTDSYATTHYITVMRP